MSISAFNGILRCASSSSLPLYAECKFAEQEYRITITFKDPAGNGLTWKSTDVEVSGVATVPEILEKLSAEVRSSVPGDCSHGMNQGFATLFVPRLEWMSLRDLTW